MRLVGLLDFPTLKINQRYFRYPSRAFTVLRFVVAFQRFENFTKKFLQVRQSGLIFAAGLEGKRVLFFVMKK